MAISAADKSDAEDLKLLYIIIIILLALLICTVCIGLYCWMRSRYPSTGRRTEGTIELSAPHGNVTFAQQKGLRLDKLPVYSNEGYNGIRTDEQEQPGSPFELNENDKEISMPDIDQPGSPRANEMEHMHMDDMIIVGDDEVEAVDTPRENENDMMMPDVDMIENQGGKSIIKFSFNSEADAEVIDEMQTPVDNDEVYTPVGNEDEDENGEGNMRP